MPAPVLAARLAAGETLVSGWVTLPGPLVAESVARAGFDCVTLDMQHGFLGVADVLAAIGAVALGGKPAIVRVPVGDNAVASRVLDLGAEAVIAPMINSAAEARALVAATKYPPVGERSWGPARARMLRGTGDQEHLDGGNRVSVAFAMIETERALESLEEILAVEGLDGVFVGPSDLSVTLSGGKRIAPFDPALDQPIRRIAERANLRGKVPGIYAATTERARLFKAFGYRLIALGSDQSYLAAGAASALASF